MIVWRDYNMENVALGSNEKARDLAISGFFFGAPGRGRIHNLLIRSQTLYPVELRAQVAAFLQRSLCYLMDLALSRFFLLPE